MPEWLSTKAMITSWLGDAVLYELWVGSDGSAVDKIYFSDLLWPIGKIFHFKQTLRAKQVLGITKLNAERREDKDTSVLRSKPLKHSNLVRYSKNLKMEFSEMGSSSSSVSQPPFEPSSSSTPRRTPSSWRSNPKPKPKKVKTEEEKAFRRRAKYFLVTQLVAVVIFLSILGGSDEVDVEEDNDLDYYA
ncbi:hypothetical protein IFM89_004568 [Coptis chinensis]|uniref:Uncharacterized protein n=1 Tax=Coptis chinensis TaxID=261450 RepID=A0A835H3G5_9MAGN|nr:hypothetical protein IFM89_004568 [Coptis chinensis]